MLVFGQLLRGLPGGAIDALQLGLGLITPPVGTGDTFQLKGLGIQLTGVGHMGAGAEVPPLFAEGIEGDWFLQSGQDFQLVWFVLGLDLLLGLSASHNEALQGQATANNFAHLLLNRLEIGFRERFGVVKVVIEARFRPGANRHLGLGK